MHPSSTCEEVEDHALQAQRASPQAIWPRLAAQRADTVRKIHGGNERAGELDGIESNGHIPGLTLEIPCVS